MHMLFSFRSVGFCFSSGFRLGGDGRFAKRSARPVPLRDGRPGHGIAKNSQRCGIPQPTHGWVGDGHPRLRSHRVDHRSLGWQARPVQFHVAQL